jgi:hypothetical protein
MTIKELKARLASPDHLKRVDALREFRDGPFGIEVLPLLRCLLENDDVQIVMTAAECIARLGPEAVSCPAGQAKVMIDGHPIDLVWQLWLAGSKVWGYSLYSNCYLSCLEALLALKVEDDTIVEYIHNHIGSQTQDALVDTLKALKTIGSPAAIDLFRRAVAFWMPELDKTHTKKVQALAATVK